MRYHRERGVALQNSRGTAGADSCNILLVELDGDKTTMWSDTLTDDIDGLWKLAGPMP